MSNSGICFLTATEMVELIRKRQLSAREVMDAHLDQIAALNPRVNAIVTLILDQARKMADTADEKMARGDDPGALVGLPIAHKDLVLTKGIRTTFGSPLLKDYLPDRDAILVSRLREAGAICVGKTNVPEFGAGSQTFNRVFGPTLNPYDLSKTCGGSSGGAAVALACGMIPLADGSDLGGSLRNPANFCNVVGFRPSPGRVPTQSFLGWFSLPVEGPMARTVGDVALLLSVMAGPDSRSPISIAEPGSGFNQDLGRDLKGVRIGWSRDLGGLPVDPAITRVIEKHRSTFEQMGCHIEEMTFDFSPADEIFKTLRHWYTYHRIKTLVGDRSDQVKDTLLREVEQGSRLTAEQIGQAEINRTLLYERVRQLMEGYEYLILPVSQVPPFDVNQEYVTEINGVQLNSYIDWMKSCYYISVTGLPAISVPCGFTQDGLPVGLQIVGGHQKDFGVLQLAYAFEQATGFWRHKPPLLQPENR